MAKKKAATTAPKRTVKKKPSATTKTQSKTKTAASKKPAKAANSVDAVLQKFEKERDSKEKLLVTSRKQIEDLGNKAAKIEEQIAALKETVVTTEAELDQVDARRATEVAEMLTKLGVSLTDVSATTKPSPQGELEFGSGIVDQNDSNDDDDSID